MLAHTDDDYKPCPQLYMWYADHKDQIHAVFFGAKQSIKESMTMSNDGTVVNNEAVHQFEAHIDEHTALIQYQLEGNVITFFHTEVPDALQGQGIAAQMAYTALEYARSAGLNVIPRCPYIARYIEKHPEYQDLVWQS